jgi:hypothetical protein
LGSTRREFGKRVAALAAVPLVAGASAAQEKKDVKSESAPSPAQKLVEFLRARHEKNLTEDQWKEVKKKAESMQQAAGRLKQLKLKNGDEPAFAFSA